MLMSYSNHRHTIEGESLSTLLLARSSDILLYDEQLTSVARLAAYSGNVQWIDQYKDVEQQLVAALEETLDLADSQNIRAAAARTKSANDALVGLEYKSFELIKNNRSADAVALLTGGEYVDHKKTYSSGIASMLKLIADNRIRDQKELKKRLYFVLWITMCSVLYSVLLWFMVYRAISKWKICFANEEKERGEVEALVRSTNEKLESRIDERTAALRSSQKELEYQANYDELTGLPNRRYVMKYLSDTLQKVGVAGKVDVLLIDLDNFKRVNDTLGHAAGDELLKQAAIRLQVILAPETFIARLGGDEFLVVACDEFKDGSSSIGDTIIEGFKKTFALYDKEYNLPVSPSIGVTTVPDDGSDVVQVLKNADTAMYVAKEKGRNKACRFTPEMNHQNQVRMSLESKLRFALKSADEFQLYYQPQIDLQKNEMVGVEALIRWIQPDDGFIPPDKFIPIAEDTGLILEIGHWVLVEAARQSRDWRENDKLDINVSINVASQQLQQTDFTDVVINTIRERGVDAKQFGIEITESSLIGNDMVSKSNLKALNDASIKLSLDDFGTGYSALSYLKEYPFDYIKIDRSFVQTIMEKPRDAALVQGIVEMSKNIDLKVVGEGVETIEQCNLLRELGCDIVQGYYYSKPLPADELVLYLKKVSSQASDEWRKAA